MRLWSPELLPYLPELQFKGQYRELVAIMHDWRDKGKTNHLLVNPVMKYPKSELVRYFMIYNEEYSKRYHKTLSPRIVSEFKEFDISSHSYDGSTCYNGWLNTKEYLRVEMANLYEKHFIGDGKSRITNEEWNMLVDGYRKITGEDYRL